MIIKFYTFIISLLIINNLAAHGIFDFAQHLKEGKKKYKVVKIIDKATTSAIRIVTKPVEDVALAAGSGVLHAIGDHKNGDKLSEQSQNAGADGAEGMSNIGSSIQDTIESIDKIPGEIIDIAIDVVSPVVETAVGALCDLSQVEEGNCSVNASMKVDNEGTVTLGDTPKTYLQYHQETYNQQYQFNKSFEQFGVELDQSFENIDDGTNPFINDDKDRGEDLIDPILASSAMGTEFLARISLMAADYFSSALKDMPASDKNYQKYTEALQLNLKIYSDVINMASGTGRDQFLKDSVLNQMLDNEQLYLDSEKVMNFSLKLLQENQLKRDPAYVESSLDFFSVIVGLDAIEKWNDDTSLTERTLDLLGLMADGVALSLPFVSGGASIILNTIKGFN